MKVDPFSVYKAASARDVVGEIVEQLICVIGEVEFCNKSRATLLTAISFGKIEITVEQFLATSFKLFYTKIAKLYMKRQNPINYPLSTIHLPPLELHFDSIYQQHFYLHQKS